MVQVPDPDRGYWQDYLSLLQGLSGDGFTTPEDLTRLLPDSAVTASGKNVRFATAAVIGKMDYEQHIFATGQVSTRQDNWHDLFNALVWARFPRIKSAMNALHQERTGPAGDGRRGRLRDALTLFDECGLVVASSDRQLLKALARREWTAAFLSMQARWRSGMVCVLTGHAMLEKCLRPYKAMTANALLVHARPAYLEQSRDAVLECLDQSLAKRMLSGQILAGNSDLCPIPISGIPGWWPGGEQDQAFYADSQVFRPRRPGQQIRPVFDIEE